MLSTGFRTEKFLFSFLLAFEMLLLLHFRIQRALKIGGDAAEFSHGLAEGAGNTCQALGPQHHEGHKKDNQKFRTADTEHIFLCC